MAVTSVARAVSGGPGSVNFGRFVFDGAPDAWTMRVPTVRGDAVALVLADVEGSVDLPVGLCDG